MRVKTGTTSGSSAQEIQRRNVKLEPTLWEWQPQMITFQTRVQVESGQMDQQMLKWVFGRIGNTDAHFGFK